MSSTEFTLQYTLKAHTPMIHFQSQQQGVTLRATEVKPKLDKFITSRLGEENIPQDWYTGSTRSFNYKLRFRATGDTQICAPHKMYYGNSGKHLGDPEFAQSVKCDCTMQVLCFIPALREAIDQCIGEFFICTNFGRMQSKGFGSFTVENHSYTSTDIGRLLCQSTGAAVCYTFRGSYDDNLTFDDIQLLYAVMKSGFNRTSHFNPRPDQYHRSYLFEYFHNEGIGNEKAAMKRSGISPTARHPDNRQQIFQQDCETYQYVRALLGICDHLEYITAFELRTNTKGITGYFPAREKEVVLVTCPDVSRFASPIFFKVIDGVVYIAAKRIHADILGKEFQFTQKSTGNSICLCVPEQFDIDGFMAWFVQRYNQDMQSALADSRNSFSIKKPVTVAYVQQGGSTNV